MKDLYKKHQKLQKPQKPPPWPQTIIIATVWVSGCLICCKNNCLGPWGTKSNTNNNYLRPWGTKSDAKIIIWGPGGPNPV